MVFVIGWRGMDIVLTCTTHDPDGQFVPLLKKWFPAVRERFEKIVVSSSPGLHRQTHDLLTREGVEVHVLDRNDIGTNYRTAIRDGSKHGNIFYADLDRILHWAGLYPQELDQVLKAIGDAPWVVFERSAQALATHQKPLRETERWFTAFFDTLSGWGMHDYLSGEFYLKASLAELLNQKLTRTDQGWWGELYVILLKAGHRPVFIPCDGLEWETPDRFEDEIKALGLEAWRVRFETLKEWELRTKWALEFIDGALAAWNRDDL